MSKGRSAGHVGVTVADSAPCWELKKPRQNDLPNILLVVFDDTGWADFGCYGSEIATPNIDSLAATGLRYNNFHVTPLCSPTRACLMTGLNHHRVGMRFLADIDTGYPNSRGRVHLDIPMLPEQLRANDYGSYLVGKWHLAPQHEVTPAGPFRHWPIARGFDRFYGFMDGCTDQFTPELYSDNHPISPPAGKRPYHLTTDLADQALTMLSDHAVFRDNDAFFMTFAPGATHAPLQAPRELIDKYVPVFEKGWDQTRVDRLKRQKELGVVPEQTDLTERNPGAPAWSDLDDDERRLYVRQQAAYAAFLEHADNEIGRIVKQLENLGLRENTLIFVLSDNGASREGGRFGAVDINGPYSGVRPTAAEQIADIDRIGGPNGPAHYPEGWAMAGNTPFRRYKQSVDLGGVRSPLVVNWPAAITARGEVRSQFIHAIDIAATVVDLARLQDPSKMDGVSLRNTFMNANAPSPRTTQYWEMFGHRAIWQNGWKAVTEHQYGVPYEEDEWRLYNVNSDFSERHNVAGQHPERLRSLVDTWWREAKSNEVLPLDDRSLVELLNNTKSPHQVASRKRLVLWPQNSHLPVSFKISGTARSVHLSTQLIGRGDGENGVIVASGTVHGGYTFHVRDNEIFFENTTLGEYFSISSKLPPGTVTVALKLQHREDTAALVSILLNERVVSQAILPRSIRHLSFWGLDIGNILVNPASRYEIGDSAFRDGVLGSVALEFLEPLSATELAELMIRTE